MLAIRSNVASRAPEHRPSGPREFEIQMLTRTVLLLALSYCSLGLCLPQEVAVKSIRPVPPATDCDKVLTQLHDKYRTEYAEASLAGRRALARSFVDLAHKPEVDATGFYVLLTQARDLAVQGADLPTAFSAIDCLSGQCAVDSRAEKTRVVLGVCPNVREGDAGLAAATALGFVEDCLELDEFGSVQELLASVKATVKRAKDETLSSRLAVIQSNADAASRAASALAQLKQKPDDAKAYHDIGCYYVFVRNDLEKGFQYLGKSSDEPMRRIALEELQSPVAAQAQSALGDLWFDWAGLQSGQLKRIALGRALHWYNAALASTTGLDKALLEKRLGDIETLIASLPQVTQQRGTRSFVGTWETTYGDMFLKKDGDRLAGTYSLGTIDGKEEGLRFTFEYTEAAIHGTGIFELATDGEAFTGQWRADGVDEWKTWTGSRVRGDLGSRGGASERAKPQTPKRASTPTVPTATRVTVDMHQGLLATVTIEATDSKNPVTVLKLAAPDVPSNGGLENNANLEHWSGLIRSELGKRRISIAKAGVTVLVNPSGAGRPSWQFNLVP